MSLINTLVQPFKVNAFHNGKFIEVTEESLKGKWSVLIFMPAAFTFNCPTEIEDAANSYAEFQKAGDRKSTRLTPVTNAHLVCRLLLEKKNIQHIKQPTLSTPKHAT